MSSGERDRATESVEDSFPIGEVRVGFPIRREDFDEAGNITNLEKEEELIEILTKEEEEHIDKGVDEDKKKRPLSEWFNDLRGDVESGKKRAWYYAAIGGVVVLVGSAGIEFGLLHGKDIKELIEKVDKYKENHKRPHKKK